MPEVASQATVFEEDFIKAIKQGNLETISQLLENDEIRIFVITEINNLLSLAVENEKTDIFKRLLQTPGLLFYSGMGGVNPLTTAIRKDNFDTIKSLLEIDGIESIVTKMTLMHAVNGGNINITARLFQIGAVRALAGTLYKELLLIAFGREHFTIASQLLEINEVIDEMLRKNDFFVMVMCAQTGCLRIIDRLLEIEKIVADITDKK